MRVIAGSARSRTLMAPRGGATRPTSDLIRGAIFDMLVSSDVDLSLVLDLYAGSGALGIEALSRGSGVCDFVERDPRACDVIRRNLRETGLTNRGTVYCMAVDQALTRLRGPYTLVLADPPYADRHAEEALASWAREAELTEDAILVLERARRSGAPERMGPLRRIRERSHGETTIGFYVRATDEQEGNPGEGEKQEKG